jgi:predicted flap endonuclease-1-like 5' DNA nuclease/archaellum component FlaC
VQILRTNLKRHEADGKRLQAQISQGEERVQKMTAHAEEHDRTIAELRGAVSERDSQIQALKSRAEGAEAQVRALETSLTQAHESVQGVEAELQRQGARVKRLQGDLLQSEEAIRDLSARSDWRRSTISQLEEVVSDGYSQFEELKSRAEEAEAKATVLEAALREREEETAKMQLETAPSRVAPRGPVAPEKRDDLKRVEGIGPKISRLLQDAGVMTFAQLATTEVSRLRQILADADLTALADPATWPEQAELASKGDWKALETLQVELKGGRRVR